MLARYKVLHELGRGPTGAVYAARDRESDAAVALKRLDPALLTKSDPDFARRFLKHARSAQRLNHRNIAAIRDAGEAAGTVYVAMEMLEGESLRKILDAGPLPAARAIRIAHDIASGLAHAHLEGVLHGGLRPSNIFVLRSGVVKITDFGIAQLGRATPGYLSPEQARGDPIDHRSDLFSLGALLYEMLAHRPPGESAEPAAPSEVNPHVPRALDDMILKLLARNPNDRLPGAPIVLRELQQLEEALGLGSSPSPAEQPAAVAPREEPRPAPNDAHREPTTGGEAFDYQKAIALMERESRAQRISESRPGRIMPALAIVLALVGIGLAGWMYFPSGPAEQRVSVAPRPAAPAAVAQASNESATARPASLPPAPAAVAQAVKEPPAPAVVEPAMKEPVAAHAPAPPAAQPSAAPKSETPVARPPEQPRQASTPQAQKLPLAKQPPAKAPQRQPAATAKLILAVSPRGEIYIDGKHHGTSPPLTTFDLEPGMRRIEVRSGSRKPFLTYMTIEPGEERRIRHDFDAKPIRPPS